MSEKASASVGYDDLIGEISVDGESCLMITFDLPRSGIPRGYVPVAIQFHYSGTEDEKHLDISALAIDADLLDVVSADGIRKYARENGRLIVRRFETPLTLEKLLPLVKRLSVLLRDECTEGVPLIVDPGKSYKDDE